MRNSPILRVSMHIKLRKDKVIHQLGIPLRKDYPVRSVYIPIENQIKHNSISTANPTWRYSSSWLCLLSLLVWFRLILKAWKSIPCRKIFQRMLMYRSTGAKKEPPVICSPSGTGTTPPAPPTVLQRNIRVDTATTRLSAFVETDLEHLIY